METWLFAWKSYCWGLNEKILVHCQQRVNAQKIKVTVDIFLCERHMLFLLVTVKQVPWPPYCTVANQSTDMIWSQSLPGIIPVPPPFSPLKIGFSWADPTGCSSNFPCFITHLARNANTVVGCALNLASHLFREDQWGWGAVWHHTLHHRGPRQGLLIAKFFLGTKWAVSRKCFIQCPESLWITLLLVWKILGNKQLRYLTLSSETLCWRRNQCRLHWWAIGSHTARRQGLALA